MTLHVLRRSIVTPLVFGLMPLVAWACGGSDTNGGTPPPADTTPDAAGTDASPPPPPPPPHDAGNTVGNDSGSPIDSGSSGTDAGNADTGPSSTYPAPHPPFPTVSNNGGPVLTAPNIVTVSFASEGASTISDEQTFDDTITTSAWWQTVTAGYCSPEGSTNCIGQGTSGGHITLSETAPAALTDTQQAGSQNTMWTFIQDHVTNGGASGATGQFPAPTANTIYAIYFPSTTTITYGGSQSCSSFGGYHGALPVTPAAGGAAVSTAYAVLPSCQGFDIHIAASHEFMEAASDPGTGNSLTYFMTDPGYLILNGDLGEIGDLCVGLSTTSGSYTVQRIWNNVEALASSSPCAPFTGLYFNTAVQQQVTPLQVGQSTTLTLTGYSTAAAPDWTVQAQDLASANGGTALTQVSIDKTTLNNGETATLTVKLLAKPPKDPVLGGDYAVFFISSTDTTNANNGHGWAAAIQGP